MSRAAAVGASLLLLSCGMEEPSRLHTTHPAPKSSGSVAIEPRQPLLPTYPCSRCHADRAPDPTERKLTEFHTQKILSHGKQAGWCYRCHDKDHIDELRLPDGTRVGFDEAYELCGACHGDKARDFKNGIHGLTTGYWLGDTTRRSCPYCHDPHDPHYRPMIPERAPERPRTAPAEVHGASEEQHGEAH